MHTLPHRLVPTAFAAVLCASAASAQWSSNPATNLSLADRGGDQVQPKLAPTGDGGAYLSWFDGIGTGYDTRLQKVTANGIELFPHNGVLVMNTSFSSTQDYGLDTDSAGNALIVNRDDSQGGTQIGASKVSPAGALLWGASSVLLTNTADFVASPKIAGTSDGAAVVAWKQASTVRLQRLDANGNALWGAGITLTPPAGDYSVGDLHDAGTHVILSIVHQTGNFNSPRHLLAQKFDAAGNAVWGASPIAVFDGGSLQIGNFPSFVPDGSGGAVFSWYRVSPLQSYAQRVLSNGTEAFPHNGSVASTDVTRVRVNPSVTFDAGSDSTFLFWVEQNSLQSQFGLYAQKFDVNGNRLWGTEGVAFLPLGGTEIGLVRGQVSGLGAFVFWSAGGFGAAQLFGAHFNAAGAVDISTFVVASTASNKSRLAVARSTSGQSFLSWSDDRADSGDVLGQNVTPAGHLGFRIPLRPTHHP
jgi:hypothetical protein